MAYEIQWNAGNRWGIEYVEAKNEKKAHEIVRSRLFGSTKRFASLLTISSYN